MSRDNYGDGLEINLYVGRFLSHSLRSAMLVKSSKASPRASTCYRDRVSIWVMRAIGRLLAFELL
jgi:hypothetical protein